MSIDGGNLYDFIVVGAGPAGCTLALRLAKSRKKPRVLLVEAGGKNDLVESRIDGERWLHKATLPGCNWQSSTVPQTGLGGRVLKYDRGKGLGGGTAINYSYWTIGPASLYDEIAEVVGDDEWRWLNAQARFKRLESYHSEASDVPAASDLYLNPKADNHGAEGPIQVGFPAVWEASLKNEIDIWIKNGGAKRNLDHNSGDPIGMAVCASSAYKGKRSTAADTLLQAPDNLTILTDASVAQVIFEARKAFGIQTLAGEKYRASCEVLLCAGSLGSPQILMHSGIGPFAQLSRWDLALLQNNKNVGEHLRDHLYVPFTWEREEHTSERSKYYKSKEAQANARTQWEKDGTGPLAEFACTAGIGSLQLESMFSTSEYRYLQEDAKLRLKERATPMYEICLGSPTAKYFQDPENTRAASTIIIVLLGLQSVGAVRLQSPDPAMPLLFDPHYFSHPFDRRLAIEATRALLEVSEKEEFKKDTLRRSAGPESMAEQDILEYWKQTSGTAWHACGTARMGRSEAEAVVDKDFKVFGVQSLRVIDLSVIPFLPSMHTQTMAYLVGLMAGDKLVFEYAMDDNEPNV
ncbi:MAG: hypothetical protein CYPHOPRED_003595, partial [Cyphobasidiales sp. Tagirdzhanova-0007]